MPRITTIPYEPTGSGTGVRRPQRRRLRTDARGRVPRRRSSPRTGGMTDSPSSAMQKEPRCAGYASRGRNSAVIQTEISISDLLFRLMGELLSPCRCSGSVRSTHQPCLIKWISERGSWACELCYYKYQVIAISTKNPLQWQAISLTVIEKVQIAAAILGSLFLIASISWLVWSSLSPSAKWQRQDLLFQICYGMYGFMDVVCIALIVHEGPSVFRIFHRWQAVNQQWKVLNYDKKQDSEEQKNNEEWTRSLLHQREPAGADVSPSPSSLMAAAGTQTLTNITAAAQDSYQTNALADGPALQDQHCPYNLLHLLSHLRPHEARSPATNISTNTTKPREVVMRVTTV
ncbi:E3 ubiquitin-protein ligase MARCH4-like isoform X2 [Carassius auratus]|uniref:RING-type E3 ubiquitin transferase n=1 Tax=Carassius auratus TaxID=7957 RepID=A0A6P6KLK4_CARAU|nr:E3 ubiquitin-protein ligase MARCH4-like isoform X2 [Carassius auratus]